MIDNSKRANNLSSDSANIESDNVEPGGEPTARRPENLPLLDLILLVFCSAIILASFLMQTQGPTQVFLPGSDTPMPEICSFRRLLHIDCPGCGLTRAFISISSADLPRAWSFNPAGFLVYILIAFQIPWRSYLLFRWSKKRPRVEVPYGMAFVVTMAIALVFQWLVKLVILIF